MKILFFLIILFFFCGLTYAQHSSNFKLSGHIRGKQTDEIWFRYPDINGKIIQEKVVVNNNAFVITGYIASPANVEFGIGFDTRAGYIKNYFGNLFIGPGAMTVSLKANDLSSATISGSVMQDDWNNLKKQKQALAKKRDSAYKKSWSATAAGNTPINHQAQMKSIIQIQGYQKQEREVDYQFIQSHPNAYLSAYLTAYYLTSEKLSATRAQSFYNAFSVAVQRSIAGVSLQKQLAKH